MMTDQEQHELSRLILELVDGYISDERLELLDRWLMESNEAMAFYCDHIKNAALLKHRYIYLYQASASPCQDMRVWKALAISEKTAPGITLKRTKSHPDRFSDVVSDSTAKTTHISKLFLYSAILSTAAFMLILAYLNYWAPPVTQSVATLVDSFDVRWALPSEAFNVGSRLKNRSQVLRLVEGVIKVAFDYGAEVIIEGPAEFEPESAEKMILHSGRVFARVPDSARGFTIQTPYSTVVDLGTEFGVYVADDRIAEVHMFQGKAMLVAGTAGASSRHQITAGQSRAVSQSGQIREISTRENAFIRDIFPQSGLLWRGENIDLADVLGGGSGFGDGLRNYSINPDTGQWQEGFHRREGLSTTAQCSYVIVEDLPLIDGVFVPDGRRSPVVVSSRGDVFEGCPATDGQYYWNISNGFYIHDDHYRQTLGGVRYGTEDHPAISMHANSGITFDLDRMREKLPEFELTAFRSLCGKTPINPVLEMDGPVDFYVLVDGQVRFHYENVTAQDEPRLVNVSLSGDDRFLTLVILSRTKLNSRRGLFALPEIVIHPRYN